MSPSTPCVSSSKVSEVSARPKKLVGGSCLGSPTMTTCLARAMAPMASQTGICEASSKMTMSKLLVSALRYWAMDSGLISRQGVRRSTAEGICSSSWRSGRCWRFLVISRRRMPHSLLRWMLSADGRPAHSRARIHWRVTEVNSSSSARKSAMRRSCSAETKRLSTSSSSTASASHQRA